ncbi:hypothetical protein [Amycolatopsis minnesotensis]|uniref:hypothetical protein n=1 Tax=Amycolatopsis minnesotensis TaxID=337894 RepID=UPI0031DD4DB4
MDSTATPADASESADTADEKTRKTEARKAAKAAREARVTELAEKDHAQRCRRNAKRSPGDREPEKALWKASLKDARAQVRREVAVAAVKKGVTGAATYLAHDAQAVWTRNQAQLAPWKISVPYLAAAELATLAVHAGGGSPVALSAACAASAAGGSVLAWRRTLEKRTPARFAAKVRGGMALAGAWAAAMPFVHAGGQIPMLAAWLGGTGYLGLSWWREHRHPVPLRADIAELDVDGLTGPQSAVEAEEVPVSMVEGILAAFAERVRVRDGAVPGGTLTHLGTAGNCAKFELALDPNGKVVANQLESRRERIALAIGVFAHQLAFEPGDRIDLVTMKVTTGRQDTVYNGPIVLCDGTPISSRWEITPGSDVDIVIGAHLDGDGFAVYRVIDAGSVNSAFILGSIGSGKTLLAEEIAIALKFLGCELWYVDGQDGASSELLKRHADWAIPLTRDAVEDLYQAVKGAADGRNLELKIRPELGNKYTYDPGRPPVITTLEECQGVFEMKNADGTTYGVLFGGMARKLRKDGMGFVAISQDLDLTSTFGGSDILRSCLMAAGNFFAMRFLSRTRAGMLPPNCPNLLEVPKHGYGYSPLAARPNAMWRAANIENSPRTKDEWMTAFPPSTLDKVTRARAGAAYRKRDESMAEDLDAARAELEFLENATDEQLDAREADRKRAEAEKEKKNGGDGKVVRFFTGGGPSTVRAGAGGDGLSEAEQRVHDVLAEESLTPTGVGEQLGISRQAAAKTLQKLVAKGAAVLMEDGRYMAKDPR